MKLTREEILAIAKKHNMEYIHETFLMRFVEEIIKTEQAKKNAI
jgi:propanediol dehydratase small subunit